MLPSIQLKSIKVNDGTIIKLDGGDILIIVGPNNSGKSMFLQNIVQMIKVTNKSTVISDIELHKDGDAKEVEDFLLKNSMIDEHTSDKLLHAFGKSFWFGSVSHNWNNIIEGLGEITDMFVCHLNTEKRLTTANPAPNISFFKEFPSNPIQYLYRDDLLEHKISTLFKNAFDIDLIVNHGAGTEIPLHCGERPVVEKGEDRISGSYIQKIEALPMIQNQGDGLRAFAGVILHALVVKHNILLIDEPEAFLHPPQARALGKMLIKEMPVGNQLLVATHSGDFLRGILDTKTDRIKIVRIERDANINNVCVLNIDDISEIWNDPILRQTNILDGLFHNMVVLCEGDADCRFYSTIYDLLCENGEIDHPQDVMFIHCGGKDRMPVVIKAMKRIGVQIKIVADIDILNSCHPLEDIYTILGGDWEEIRAAWTNLYNTISHKRSELRTDDVKREVESVLNDVTDSIIPPTVAEELRKIISRSSPWSIFKSTGRSFIPNGQPRKDYNLLIKSLNQKGFFVVECGELERFVPSVAGHGPKWVNEVLSKDIENNQELEEAKVFVKQIFHSAPH